MNDNIDPEIRPEIRASFRKRLAWFLAFRLFVATLFLGGTIFFQLRTGYRGSPELPFLYSMVALTYLQAGLSAYLLPKTNRLYLFTQVQGTWDLLLATFLIYLTGGASSHFSFLYILVIFSTSLFLRRRHILFVASAAAILYGSLLDLQYYNHLPIISGLKYTPSPDGATVFYAISVNVFAFFLTAVLSAVLAENRWINERALEKKDIDLEELESLNRTIIANISSGLMLVSSAGKIRSFNESAEHITGYSFHDVYNRDVRNFFTLFDVFSNKQFSQITRAQAVFRHKNEQELILGYSASEIRGQGQDAHSLLVVFQDLTQSIEMDRRLQRADRLAAVGRLASGMAHEIRNPLASISGSVQLLLEGEDVSDDDRRLMQIVVREADRLSLLLTDFLSFARPAKPKCYEISVSDILDDLVDMLKTDHRFEMVDIVREYVTGLMIYADQNHLKQILLDLAINAVEAMEGDGTLYFGVESESHSIVVEDTGPGIDESTSSRIFEPFFTTKEKGTGLGLATVYSIVEAHGGYIDLFSGRQGGAKFVVTLPQSGSKDYAVPGTV